MPDIFRGISYFLKICYIIKLPKKGQNVRVINDTILIGFLGSRNQIK